MGISKVVNKYKINEQPNDFSYWQSKSYEERLHALEEIRIYRNYANLTYNFPLDSKGKRTARINLPTPKRPGNRPLYNL